VQGVLGRARDPNPNSTLPAGQSSQSVVGFDPGLTPRVVHWAPGWGAGVVCHTIQTPKVGVEGDGDPGETPGEKGGT
jgi:hypothetical protein